MEKLHRARINNRGWHVERDSSAQEAVLTGYCPEAPSGNSRQPERYRSTGSYSELYGPDDASADYTKKLIELGAVVVGKTKMTQFASSDEPTDQWIDFHCPVNPRGDKYQSPSGSSSGAAASLAGYDWLDFFIVGDCESLSPLSSQPPETIDL